VIVLDREAASELTGRASWTPVLTPFSIERTSAVLPDPTGPPIPTVKARRVKSRSVRRRSRSAK